MSGLSVENNNDLFGIGAEALRGGVSAASSGLKLLQGMDGKEIKALTDAEIVKLIDPKRKKNFIPAETKPEQITKNLSDLKPLVSNTAKKYQIDESLIFAVITNESGGKLEAVSGTGAYGVMQLTAIHYAPTTQDAYKNSINPFAPEQAIDRAATFLAHLRNEFDGDLEKMAAGYNQGETAVNKAVKLAKEKGGDWKDYFLPQNKPEFRDEGLRFIGSIKKILSFQDARVSSNMHPFLANGPDMVKNNKVDSADDWIKKASQSTDIAPYAKQI